MWFLYRPDAANVWKNNEVQERYKRYKGIMDGKNTARYLIAKRIAVESDLNTPLEELWKIHDATANEFNKQLKTIDTGEINVKDLEIASNSFLDLKEKIALELLKNCQFCERRCKIDRTSGEVGFCKLTDESIVSSTFLHTGEESVLVPSGTIFFAGCTFTCVFCQNYDISQNWCDGKSGRITGGISVTPKKLALLEERLRKEGARNINFVGGDPTPNLHTIISSLKEINENITMLWNSNMYQSLEATKLLLELMDFWLPDFKFWDNTFAKEMSGVNNYNEIITRNLKLAYEQGSGEILIRHLIMPGRVKADTYPILEWCSKEIPNAMVNLMDQYHSDYLVRTHPQKYRTINRRITPEEWRKATKKADELGILWKPVS